MTIEEACKRYTIDPIMGCWLWNGPIHIKGYGQLVINGKVYYAHRFIYEYHKGKVSKDLNLDHFKSKEGCPRHCVNPDHLEPVTGLVNYRRGRRVILNEWKVYKIKERLKYDTHQSIANDFGVKKTTITMIHLGRTWKDVVL